MILGKNISKEIHIYILNDPWENIFKNSSLNDSKSPLLYIMDPDKIFILIGTLIVH